MTEEHRSDLDMHLVDEMLKMMADGDSVHYVPSFAATTKEADKAASAAGDPAAKAAAKKVAKTPPAGKTPPKPKGKPKAKATKRGRR